ncbi:hypothetical protein LCGC14_2658760 [marine sediment metagenome]|uniref:Phage major capsid protein n=1 Tax=marine sediment metagenome TaxID=412755 RepID=A0A0F8ZSG6_9ZZZZ
MKTNKQLLSRKQQIEKMISLPTITLAAEEADRFIDYIVDESVMKNKARIVKMNKETQNIRALGLGTGDFLHPGATFSTSEYKKTLSHNKIALVTQKVRGCIAIFDDDLEDNIEADAFADHLMKMVAKQIANELDIAFWIGDTGSGNAYGDTDIKSLWDGWRFRIANGDTSGDTYYNAVSGGATVLDATDSGSFIVESPSRIAMVEKTAPYNWEFKYNKMLATLASKYKVGGLSNLAFYSNDLVVQNYIEALSARSTIMGDNAILGKSPIQYGMVPIVSCPNMSTTMAGDTQATEKATTGAYTDCLLTPNGNLIIGIQRDIKIESQREAADEATYWFYSMRAVPAIENVNACVLLRKLIVTGTMIEA